MNNFEIKNEKAKKIRAKLLLYVDREIKMQSNKKNNKRYIKPYDSKNEDCFKVSFQENFNNSMGKCIHFFSSDNKEMAQNISFFKSKSNSKTTLSDIPSSSLSTQENSIKKNMSIGKLIRRQKVIPENLMDLLEKNKFLKIVKRKKSIFNCINSISNASISSYYSNNVNTLNNNEDDYIKFQNYLLRLCGNFKINLIKE